MRRNALWLLRPTSFVEKMAKVSNSTATWDGVYWAISEAQHDFYANTSYSGTVRAVSLELMAFNAEGALQFTTFGGVTLPNEVSVSKDKVELRKDLLTNTREIEEAVRLVLQPVLR
jgi:hypothetical protein